MAFDYRCCITGAIGVGKSCAYEAVAKTLDAEYKDKFRAIREYIDADGIQETSKHLLNLYLRGQLSDACFQNYIQSYYVNELLTNYKPGQIILMERSMSDSVAIFCNIANRKNKLSDVDLALMYNNCINCDCVNDFPNYFIKNFEVSVIKTEDKLQTYNDIMKVIESDIKDGIKNRVICLSNDAETCFDRVIERSRSCESYSFEDIENNVNYYENLYKLLTNDDVKEIRLTDFGYILHGDLS